MATTVTLRVTPELKAATMSLQTPLNPGTRALKARGPVVALLLLCGLAPAASAWNGLSVSQEGNEVIQANGPIWRRCVEGMTWRKGSGWHRSGNCVGEPLSLTLVEAKQRAEKISRITGLLYRLPCEDELHSITIRPVFRGLWLDKTMFPDTPQVYYWSGSFYEHDEKKGDYYLINWFAGGGTGAYESDRLGVRLVRDTGQPRTCPLIPSPSNYHRKATSLLTPQSPPESRTAVKEPRISRALIEHFNRTFRTEVLDRYVFIDQSEVRRMIKD